MKLVKQAKISICFSEGNMAMFLFDANQDQSMVADLKFASSHFYIADGGLQAALLLSKGNAATNNLMHGRYFILSLIVYCDVRRN